MQHPIDNMMQTTMESIRSMVDVNTVIGSPVLGSKGTTIIPVSKVSFGFVAGGGEYTTQERQRNHAEGAEGFPFAGGTGAGVSVQPVGFLVVGEGTVKMLPAQSSSPMERIVELLPQMLEDFKSQEKEKQGEGEKRRPFERYVSRREGGRFSSDPEDLEEEEESQL
ncbi:MAG: GerW family sporulation protein [Candidatus Limiplasma sp.]|nr:GerW family sporulation protein [Candidatus Limiplasma sp.]